MRVEYCVQMFLFRLRAYGDEEYARFDLPSNLREWGTVSGHLNDRKVNYFDYMQAIFAGQFTAMRTHFLVVPKPATVLGSGFGNRWASEKGADHYAEVGRELRAGLAHFQDAVDLHQYTFDSDLRGSVAGVLGDATSQVDPLLRSHLAEQLGFPEISAMAERAASLQFLRRRHYYRRVWGDRIPLRIRELASDVVGRFT